MLSADIPALLDTLQDSYFEADPRGIITFANRAFFENLGLPGRESVLGRNFRRFTDGRSIRKLYQKFGELYRTGEPVERFSYFFKPIKGEARPGELSISPILQDGRVIGSRGLIRDISAHVQAEQDLRRAKNAAEAQAAKLRSVNRVAATVGQSLDLSVVLQSICVELTSIFPVRNAGVALITPDRQSMEVVAFHTPFVEERSALGLILPFEGNPSSQEVIRTRKPLVLQDAQNDPRSETLSDISRARGTRAIMIVPILSRGEAIGTVGMPAVDPFYEFSDVEVELAETIAGQIAAAVDNARLHTQTESALTVAEHDLEIGRQIQAGFFPERLPDVPGWEFAAEFTAARQVAGDFYDAFAIPNTDLIGFVVGDVCDKGVGAALFMVLFRSLIRAFSVDLESVERPRESLLRLIRSTNDFIAEYHGRSNMFATLFVGLLEPKSGVLHYVNGGHEPPAVVNAEGALVARLDPTGPAVGLFTGTPYRVQSHELAPGEFIVGFTDGTTDARSAAGEPFREERLLECLTNPWTSVHSMIFELSVELKHHIGSEPQFDDITLFAVRRKTSAASPSVHAICRKAMIGVVPEFRAFVESVAQYSGLSGDQTFALKSSADELCTNIVQYGYPDRDDGLLSLSIVVERDVLARIVITDDGVHFPPEEAAVPDLDAPLEERDAGGLGLHIARSQLDRITYSRTQIGTNELVLELDLT